MKQIPSFCAALFVSLSITTASPAQAIKISTWNLDWLTARSRIEADLPADVHPRAQEDFARLAGYADKLAADIIALQEVDGPAAAALVLDPHLYTIAMIDQPIVQRVGIAVRKPLTLIKNPDLTSLDVEPDQKYQLRNGLDVTVTLPKGQPLRILVVHLKTGCQTDDLSHTQRPQCALLARQIPPLLAWIGTRQTEGTAYLVLGDFNRVFDQPETFGTALASTAPLLRVTQGRENPCWDGAPFIDHIFVGGPARHWLQPDSLRVQIYQEFGEGWKDRLSDHCPVSVTLNPPQQGAR